MMRKSISTCLRWASTASSHTLVQKFSQAFCTGARTSTPPVWVFLGPPGVGKGTYSVRIAEWLDIPQLAAGDLVRDEIKKGTSLGNEMSSIVKNGNLLPDSMIIKLLQQRMDQGRQAGEVGYLIDGFPRTLVQAKQLLELADVQLALNLQLREDVLIDKCLGRRICRECGKNYNVADIRVPAENGLPEILMPPLPPPTDCERHLEIRADDTEEVVHHRLAIYKQQAEPVEAFFKEQQLLVSFQITGGIPETLPRLKQLLEPYAQRLKASSHYEGLLRVQTA